MKAGSSALYAICIPKAEYTALIMGMKLARDIKVHQLEVRGN